MNETNEGNTTYARACKIHGAMEIASHLLKSLEQSRLKLPDSATERILIQPVCLLECVEPTYVRSKKKYQNKASKTLETSIYFAGCSRN
jgi:hypothetical protein